MQKELRILVVEDVPADAELEIRELKRAGLRVAHRRVDTEEAFRETLREFQPEIILSDFSMPHFDGMFAFALARELVPDVPFIFVSGTIGEEYAIRALKNGAADYVLKNNLVRLPPAVERALQDTKEREARRRIEKEQARLVAIIEATPDMVATSTPDRRVLYCNAAGRGMMGIGADTDASEILVHENHPEWAAKLVLEQGIPTALSAGVWSGETALLSRDGREIPVLQVIIAHKGSDGAVEYLSTIMRDITQRKEQETRVARLNRIYSVLSGINTLIVRVRERQELFDEACRIAVEHGKFVMAWIGLLDQQTMEVRTAAHLGFDPDLLDKMKLSARADLKEGQGTTGRALREQKPVFHNDMMNNPHIGALRSQVVERGYQSIISLPLVVEGKSVAVLVLYAKEAGFFNEEELKLLTELAGDISFALDHIAKEEKLHYLAYYDALTELPNRALFDNRMAQRLRAASHKHSTVALVLFDLERFGVINDALGRTAADKLLKLIAERLQGVIFDRDNLARVQAGVFAALFADVGDEIDIARIVEEKIIACLGLPFTFDGQEVRVSAKAGVALYPSDATEPDALFINAEIALKQAKGSSERYVFYARKMNARVAERLKLENKLQRALERDEFVLYYQPKVDLRTGRVIGFEALMRWNDPDVGLVPPMEFIPVLEETGMIVEVGAWAMKQSVLQYAVWRAAGLRPLRIAVNVSQVQLKRKDFVASAQQAIAIAGKSGHGLDLEITESMIMEDVESSIEKLKLVRALGTGIAIDDFGTGYSSLRYLARLPVTALKIDRAFVRDMTTNPDNRAIVSTVISLAHNMKLTVIAEGVETGEQRDLLKQLECDEMQGYLFSKPVPAEQVPALLAR